MLLQSGSPLRSLQRLGLCLSGALILGIAFSGCVANDRDWVIDQSSGATAPRGGSEASNGGMPSNGGDRTDPTPVGGSDTNDGGSGPVPDEYPAPTIDSMDPTSGPYGTLITIKGQGLGNPALKGFTLALGKLGEVTLASTDKTHVTSWTDEEITFRFPFPAEGVVAFEGPKGSAMVGEFQPTWHIGREIDKAPAASVLASISPVKDHIEMLFDTTPMSLIDVGPMGITEHTVTADGVDASTIRLYLDAAKKLQGVGVSTDAAPVIVALQNMSDDLIAKPTTLKLQATEFGVAGGTGGASVWMNRSTGWFRARPNASNVWAQDKGPIADPNPDAPDHASGNTSDGSLFVGWSVDTGNFLDDMEGGRMQQLTPAATKFGATVTAGNSVDDYVTSLKLTSSGDGLVVTTCGSDVDPFGLSGTNHYCFDSLHAPGGAHLLGVPLNEKASAHAFTLEKAVAAYCSRDSSWLIRTDTDVESMPGAPLGETVLYPCPEAVALEVTGVGDFLPVIRWDGKTYLLERNPAALAK